MMSDAKSKSNIEQNNPTIVEEHNCPALTLEQIDFLIWETRTQLQLLSAPTRTKHKEILEDYIFTENLLNVLVDIRKEMWAYGKTKTISE